VEQTAIEAGRHLEYIRLLAKNEERLPPYTAETIRPHLVAALRNRKAE
jgi:hypothetical protein